MKDEFNTYWQFKDSIIDIVRESLKKGNKINTIVRKLQTTFNDNPKLFKNKFDISTWRERYITLETKEKCFDFLKSGFFKPENQQFSIKICDINSIGGYDDDTYKLTDVFGKRHLISERDYDNLKIILH